MRRQAPWTSRPVTAPSSRPPARSPTSGGRVLGLGGDHSVSLPLLRAAHAAHGQLSLLQLDAHTDTWDSYFGARYTHGTIFRRAVEEGLIDGGASVQIGLRGSLYAGGGSGREPRPRLLHAARSRLRGRGRRGGPGARRAAQLRSPVYVTVDIDVLDPAFAPGTGTPEAGGLTSRELLALLSGLAGLELEIAGSRRGRGVAAVRPGRRRPRWRRPMPRTSSSPCWPLRGDASRGRRASAREPPTRAAPSRRWGRTPDIARRCRSPSRRARRSSGRSG